MISNKESDINKETPKEDSVSHKELERRLIQIEAESKAFIERLELQKEAKIERMREEYGQEIQSLVQMLQEEKQKNAAKPADCQIDKCQQVDIKNDANQENNDNNVDTKEDSNDNDDLPVCILSEFDIDEWRKKEIGWEENKKILENNIHQLKRELKDQNEFLELKNKGKLKIDLRLQDYH